MARPYSRDLRERVVRAVEGGLSRRKAAAVFELAASTVVEWVRVWRESGGLSAKPYGELMVERPDRAVEKAVRGMLPHTTLGRAMLKKLKVYSGPNHPHAAQQPVPFEITQVAQ